MNIVYRKTAKGIAEIETRAHRLLPRLRSALILVDGKKSGEELATLIAGDAAATLAGLQSDGFIEVLATLADRPPERKASASSSAPSGTSAAREAAGGGLGLDALRSAAARDLNHQLGPNAEIVTLKIERAKSLPELQPLLVQGAQMLRRLKGAASADAFEARFIHDQGP
jgi:hypothetical protein